MQNGDLGGFRWIQSEAVVRILWRRKYGLFSSQNVDFMNQGYKDSTVASCPDCSKHNVIPSSLLRSARRTVVLLKSVCTVTTDIRRNNWDWFHTQYRVASGMFCTKCCLLDFFLPTYLLSYFDFRKYVS